MVKDREAWHATLYGVAKSWKWLREWTTTTRQVWSHTGRFRYFWGGKALSSHGVGCPVWVVSAPLPEVSRFPGRLLECVIWNTQEVAWCLYTVLNKCLLDEWVSELGCPLSALMNLGRGWMLEKTLRDLLVNSSALHLQNQPSQRVATFPQTRLSCSRWGLQMLHNQEVLKVLSWVPSLFRPHHGACRILVPPPGMEPTAPAGSQPRTTREVPQVPPATSEVHFPWHAHQHWRYDCACAHIRAESAFWPVLSCPGWRRSILHGMEHLHEATSFCARPRAEVGTL